MSLGFYLLDGMYHVNQIKKGSAHTLQGIVSTFDGYEKALKNTLLNKFAIETPDNKIQEVTLEDGSKELNYLPGTIMDYASIYGRSVMPKFRKTNKVNYRQEDEIVNSPHSCTSLECSMYRTPRDGEIDIMRWKRDTSIQYRHEKKEDVKGFIPKPIAHPEYGAIHQHQGMLLQNLHRRYLYIVM